MELNKVNSNQVGATQVSEQSKLQKKTAVDVNDSAATKSSVAPSGDRVEISSDASIMAKAMDAVRSASDVRADRVAELKKAIHNGTYKVDAKKVADKMLDSSIEEGALLGRKK